MIKYRRICWPTPDATCLEGGCGYCNGHPFRAVGFIRAYAQGAGEVPNRYGGESKSALTAFEWGLDSGWPNVEQIES